MWGKGQPGTEAESPRAAQRKMCPLLLHAIFVHHRSAVFTIASGTLKHTHQKWSVSLWTQQRYGHESEHVTHRAFTGIDSFPKGMVRLSFRDLRINVEVARNDCIRTSSSSSIEGGTWDDDSGCSHHLPLGVAFESRATPADHSHKRRGRCRTKILSSTLAVSASLVPTMSVFNHFRLLTPPPPDFSLRVRHSSFEGQLAFHVHLGEDGMNRAMQISIINVAFLREFAPSLDGYAGRSARSPICGRYLTPYFPLHAACTREYIPHFCARKPFEGGTPASTTIDVESASHDRHDRQQRERTRSMHVLGLSLTAFSSVGSA